MSIEKLKEILNHESEAGVSIVTRGINGPHLTNTWNSYINYAVDSELVIPAGGMNLTESNIQENDDIILSITNANVQGYKYLGTGVVVNGKGKFISSGQQYDDMKVKFPWIRAILKVEIVTVKQTY